MRIFQSLEEVPVDIGPTIVTVGNFDGVHCGHQEVLREVVRRARESGNRAVAVTFEPHPLRVLRPEMAPPLITPQRRKEVLLGQTGLDALLVLPFTLAFSMTTAQEFARDILAGRLLAKEVHEGENFHFGHGARGTTSQLAEFGSDFGFAVKSYPLMIMRGSPVSSSHIRKLLHSGNVSRARHLLGRIFSISAGIATGRGYGSKYTVPTINLARYAALVPGHGVYLTRTRVDGQTFNSVTNIGNRPTFGDDSFAIETHLLDFHPLDVHPETEVEISFLRWRRPEIRFPTVAALKQQITEDVHRAERFFRLRQSMSGKPEPD